MNFLKKWLFESKCQERPTLEQKLQELADKHGFLVETKFVDGKVHYIFIDGTTVYFKSTLTGMQMVYVTKWTMYDIYNY